MRLRTCLLFAAVMLSLNVSVKADTFTLTLSGEVDTFSLPASPVVDESYDFGFSFASVPVEKGGVEADRQIDFFDAPTGGGLLIESAGGVDFNGQGDALYAGTNAQPTFLLGTFDLIGTSSGIMTISNPTAAPEPESVLLLATGFIGILGISGRKRAG